MSVIERDRIEAIVDLCLTARKRLGSDGSFRSRVLLDMLLLELGKELARHTCQPDMVAVRSGECDGIR